VPPSGGKYNGALTVTIKHLLYDAKFDVSFKGMLAEAAFIKGPDTEIACTSFKPGSKRQTHTGIPR